MPRGKKQTLEEGYERFVIRNAEGCWGWKGCIPKNPGYGQFRTCMKKVRAHIASWQIHFGEIPEGIFVCHKCDNKVCSNPEHLFLGTSKDNSHDAISKGLLPTIGKKRDENHRTKIFSKHFKKIFYLHENGINQRDISYFFNVSQTVISNVISKSQGVEY